MAVVFTLSSGTITGLTSGNTYYVIRSSSTLVKLASSLANAVAGTPVDMTAKSSPVWTITHGLTARSVGEKGGEEIHTLTAGEAPVLAATDHVHQEQFANDSAGPFVTPAVVATVSGGGNNINTIKSGTSTNNTSLTALNTLGASTTVVNAGGGSSHNEMSPYGVALKIIKT